MKDGTILIWKYRKVNNWCRDLIPRLIVYFTKKPYVHAAIYFDEKTYESAASGIRSTSGLKQVNEYWEPIISLTITERNSMQAYLLFTTNRKWKYNFFKLIILSIVYPTRWFWNKIGWVPFDKDLFGEVCSVYVDEAWLFAGRDILPNEHEGYTSPGDLVELSGFKKVDRKE